MAESYQYNFSQSAQEDTSDLLHYDSTIHYIYDSNDDTRILNNNNINILGGYETTPICVVPTNNQHSISTSPFFDKSARDWNEEFQQTLYQFSKSHTSNNNFSSNNIVNDDSETASKLLELCTEFGSEAAKIAQVWNVNFFSDLLQVIISEKDLSIAEKTIKSIELVIVSWCILTLQGGIAGGSKYICKVPVIHMCLTCRTSFSNLQLIMELLLFMEEMMNLSWKLPIKNSR